MQLWTQVGGERSGKQLRLLAEKLDHWSGEDRNALLRILGAALSQIGDAAGAEKLWREAARRQPRDLPVRLMLVESAARAGRVDELSALTAEIEKAEGSGGPLGQYARALAGWRAAR